VVEVEPLETVVMVLPEVVVLEGIAQSQLTPLPHKPTQSLWGVLRVKQVQLELTEALVLQVVILYLTP
jgi:hypothetical protein